jgi:hypothetical protein
MGRDPTYGYLMKIKDCMLGGGRREGLRGGGDGREGRRRLQRSAAGEEERREGEREAKLEIAGWGSARLEEREALGSRGKDEIRGGRGGGDGAEGGGGKAEEEEGEGIGAPGSGPLREEEGGEGDKEGRKEREGTAESGDDGGDRPAEEQALPSEETKISLEHFLGCQQVGSARVWFLPSICVVCLPSFRPRPCRRLTRLSFLLWAFPLLPMAIALFRTGYSCSLSSLSLLSPKPREWSCPRFPSLLTLLSSTRS